MEESITVLYEIVSPFLFQDFIEQIAIAPLKLQKQRDIIFRNIKEILVLHKNHILPDIENIKEADDIARILLKMVRRF